MEPVVLLDAAGRRRPPATLPGHHRGRPPRKGVRYPVDPPPLNVIQRQLGHAHLEITSVYLRGIDNAEISSTPSTPAAHP